MFRYVVCGALIGLLLLSSFAASDAGSEQVSPSAPKNGSLNEEAQEIVRKRIMSWSAAIRPLEKAGQWKDARIEYQKIHSDNPDDVNIGVWALFNVGRTFFSEEKYDAALEKFQMGLKLTEGKTEMFPLEVPLLLTQIGDCHNKKSEYVEAESAYRTVIENARKGGGATTSSFALGRLVTMCKEGRTDEDVPTFLKRTISELPQGRVHENALMRLAMWYDKGKNFEGAVGAYRNLERAYPNTLRGQRVPLFVGKLHEKKGDKETALKLYKEALVQYEALIEAESEKDNSEISVLAVKNKELAEMAILNLTGDGSEHSSEKSTSSPASSVGQSSPVASLKADKSAALRHTLLNYCASAYFPSPRLMHSASRAS